VNAAAADRPARLSSDTGPPAAFAASIPAMIRVSRSRRGLNCGWSMSSVSGNTCFEISEVMRKTCSRSRRVEPNASCSSGRVWSRTYIVAYTASRKKRIHSLFGPQQLRVRAHQQRERLAVAELVVAPAARTT
jgi:hypothetical protein